MALKQNDIDITLRGKVLEEQGIVLHGISEGLKDHQSMILRGTVGLEDSLDAVLKGKTINDLGIIATSKSDDEITLILTARDPRDIFVCYHFREEEIEDFEITSGNLINEVCIKYNYDYADGKYLSAITKHNPISKRLYGESRKTLELRMIQATRQAERIADAVLKTSSIPEILCTFKHSLQSLFVEVGDIVALSHRAGLGENGYEYELCEVLKRDVSLSGISYKVAMKPSNLLYLSELVNISQVGGVTEPGITVEYESGVATITIYADVEGYPPVKGAEVTINGIKKVTDQNGQVRFNLDPGTYTAYIRASGYEDADITFTV